MDAIGSQIIGVSIVRSTADSPHKGPVTRKMFPFDDGIMTQFRNSNIVHFGEIFSYHWLIEIGW